jgi:chemotaxis protein MotB
MHRRKHAAHDEEHENHERWLLTYADLITLLLALFMMLYAMSVLDLRKYQAFQEAFTQGLGGHKTKANDIAPETKNPITIPSATPQPEAKNELDQEALKKLKKKLEKQLKDAGLQDDVQLELQSRGLVMNVVSGVLFPSASATLTGNGKALLKSLDVVFASFDNKLVVEGHTDPRPISTGLFPSNWELSTARATAVLRDLLGEGIRDTRLSAAGYADTRPRASNATEAGMSRNRRVDIVILAAPPKHPVTPTSTATTAVVPTTAPEAPASHGTGH